MYNQNMIIEERAMQIENSNSKARQALRLTARQHGRFLLDKQCCRVDLPVPVESAPGRGTWLADRRSVAFGWRVHLDTSVTLDSASRTCSYHGRG